MDVNQQTTYKIFEEKSKRMNDCMAAYQMLREGISKQDTKEALFQYYYDLEKTEYIMNAALERFEKHKKIKE